MEILESTGENILQRILDSMNLHIFFQFTQKILRRLGSIKAPKGKNYRWTVFCIRVFE